MKKLLTGILLILIWTFVTEAQSRIEMFKDYAKNSDSIDTVIVNKRNYSLIYIIKNIHSVSFDFHNDPIIISKIDIINKKSNRFVQTILDTIYSPILSNLLFEDINLDGYKDIIINEGGASLTPYNEVFLFNEKDGKYFYAFFLNDYYVNKKDTTIKSLTYETFAKGWTESKYKIINDKLVLLEFVSIFDNLDGTVDFQRKNYSKGKLKTALIGSLKYDSNDRFNNNTPSDTAFLEIYADHFDTLLIDSKIWMRYMNNSNISSGVSEEFYLCDPEISCYKFVKKEKYIYSFISNEIIVDTLVFKNKNNSWLRIK